MIKIVAKMMVKEGNDEKYKSIVKELVEKSAAEEGNVFYSLNASMDQPHQYAILECWKDQAAIDFHNNTEHFTGLVPKFSELLDGEMSVELFEEI